MKRVVKTITKRLKMPERLNNNVQKAVVLTDQVFKSLLVFYFNGGHRGKRCNSGFAKVGQVEQKSCCHFISPSSKHANVTGERKKYPLFPTLARLYTRITTTSAILSMATVNKECHSAKLAKPSRTQLMSSKVKPTLERSLREEGSELTDSN